MRIPTGIRMLFCLALIASIYSPGAKADEWDKKTILTFSGHVDVAGTRLEAGTYVFKLMESPSNRHVVQVFNEDETHLITTVLAMPDDRVTPTDKTVIKFSEQRGTTTESGTLAAVGVPIREWFYPGDNVGQEFKVRPAPAPVDVAQAPGKSTTVETNSVHSEPIETAHANSQSDAAPAPEPQSAQPQSATESATAQSQPAKAPTELPKTASPRPLVGLIGLLSLGVAFCLRWLSKRVA